MATVRKYQAIEADISDVHDALKFISIKLAVVQKDLTKFESVIGQLRVDATSAAEDRKASVTREPIVFLDQYVFARANHELAEDRLKITLDGHKKCQQSVEELKHDRERLEKIYDRLEKELDNSINNLVRL
jgi:septation ring formation regulator EzrA